MLIIEGILSKFGGLLKDIGYVGFDGDWLMDQFLGYMAHNLLLNMQICVKAIAASFNSHLVFIILLIDV